MDWSKVATIKDLHQVLKEMFDESSPLGVTIMTECFEFHEKGVIDEKAEIRKIAASIFQKETTDTTALDLVAICTTVFYTFSYWNFYGRCF